MVNSEQSTEYGSLARMFGENSMEAWARILLEERRCMDCKVKIEDLDGAMVFCGQLLQVELEGHLCKVCLKRREVVRCYRLTLTTR